MNIPSVAQIRGWVWDLPTRVGDLVARIIAAVRGFFVVKKEAKPEAPPPASVPEVRKSPEYVMVESSAPTPPTRGWFWWWR